MVQGIDDIVPKVVEYRQKRNDALRGTAMKHAEGSGSILKSRFARGIFPLMAALFAFALAAPSARAGDLHALIDPATLSVVANTTSGNGGGTRQAIYAVNGAGMNADGTHQSDAANSKMWEANAVSATSPGSFKVNLGRVVQLNGIKIWNYNWGQYSNRGVKDMEIYYTASSEIANASSQTPIAYIRSNWTKLKDSFVLPQAPGNATYAGEDMITFDDVEAQWVVFVITSQWGGGNGGLSEVRFYEHTVTPVLGDVSLTRTGAATYSLTATEDANAADLSYILSDGETVTTNATQSVDEGGTATWAITGLTANKTYQVSVLAVNSNGTDEKTVGILYTGELSLGATTDANEDGPVSGTVAVSRNASSSSFPLTVNYTISSFAAEAAEGTTWAAPSAVTIPAGENTGYLLVTPLMDASVTEDVTVTVTLAAGNYELPASASSTLDIANLPVPSGYNVWVATADGIASDGANWSTGIAPTESDNVLFDGRFSTANCEWDAAATATVSSWTQTEGYTGTVTFDTTYSGAFSVFTVTGDATLNAGYWSHPLSFTTTSQASNDDIKSGETYRLNVAVGGTLSIGSGGSINVVGKGVKQTAGSSPIARHGGSVSSSGSCYGNPKYPVDVGSAAWSGTDNDAKKAAGGGAVHIVAGTAVVVDGKILADGESKAYACGAGGSILVEAPSVTGSGTIRAGYTYATGNANSVLTGAGGRVALITTNAVDLATLSVSAAAYATGGTKGSGGAGTVYLKDSAMTHGVLVVDNPKETSKKDGGPRTGVTTEGDWTFDEVRLGGWCQLVIPDGATLHLPNGLASVTALSDAAAASSSIYVTAGTLDIGASATQTMRGKWELAVYTNLVLDCSLSLEQGAMLGRYNRSATIANGADVATYDTFVCSISVTGNLTVDSTSSLSVRQSGFGQNATYYFNGYGTGSHGGCYGTSSLTDGNKAYGSILNPLLPARFQSNSYYQPGGGVLKLTVGGTLTLNGEINSDGYSGGNKGVRGAGGSINVTAGALAGSGAIHADGYSVESGGRVAVRLTGAGATFGDFSGRISARRDTTSSPTLTAPGTVYLQTAAQGEGCGAILVDGTPRSGTAAFLGDPYTPIPANGAHADDVDDLKKCSLEVSNYARCAVADALRLQSVSIDSNAILDLNGKTLTVKSAKVNGVKLAPGTYAAESTVAIGEGKLGDYLVDTADGAGGALVVNGVGLSIIVR